MQTTDVIWLLERDIMSENLIRLRLAIEEQGLKCITIPNETPWVGDRNWYDYIPNDTKEPKCVIYYGSIQGCHGVFRKTNWIPGAWCDVNKFKCSAYYPKYYDCLLNRDHEFIPFGLLHTRKDELYKKFGEDGCIFLRPDTGEKLFTGFVVEYERFDNDVFNAMPYATEDSELLVVSRPRVIHEEHRCIIVQGKCVAQSMYKPEQERNDSNEIAAYAEAIAHRYSPELCFSVDVGVTPQGLELIEINSFSCSGWYKCDLSPIVKAATQAAIVEYEDIF